MLESFLLLFILSVSPQTKDEALVRIYAPSRDFVYSLFTRGYDIASCRPGEYVDIIAGIERLEELNSQGVSFEIIRWKRDQYEIDPLYHTYDEMVAELESLEVVYSGIGKLYDIGDSWEKAEGGPNYIPKDIWAFKVSDNVEEEEDEPAILFIGLHHAREPISVEVPLYILKYLLENYGSDPEVTWTVDSCEIWFVPMMNPDGHRIVADGIDEWWRKNTRDNNSNGYFDDCDGVDNNRNYAYHWGGEGSSGNPCSSTYRGTAPFSEYENQAILNLFEEERFVISHSYHSYGEIILYPWAWTADEQAPDNALLANIADSIASYNGYSPQQSGFLYPHGGEMNDFVYSHYGTIAHTSELAQEFIPPGSQILPICQQNLPAALFLIRRLFGPGVIGHVRDSITGEPLEANFRVLEIWTDELELRRSEPQYGRFERLLLPGVYTFEFSKVGYRTKIIDSVVVQESGPTYLDVELVPVSFDVHIAGLDVVDTLNGNGNGMINPAETAELYFYLVNFGQDSIQNLTGTLRTDDPYVELIDTVSAFPDLGTIGDTVRALDPFVLYLSDSVPSGYTIDFMLILSGTDFVDTLDYELTTLPGGDFLIWDPDPNHSSGPVVMTILESLGYEGFYTEDLSPYRDALSNFEAVFIFLGVYPDNYVLEEDQDVLALTNYLDSGGNVYMEGGDTWYYDPEVSLHSYFGCDGISDGSSDLSNVIGMSGTFTEGMSFGYTGENNWIDHLGELSSTAFYIFENQSPQYYCAVANDASTYRTVAFSFELAGLSDGTPPSTREALLDSIMHFFGLAPLVEEGYFYVTKPLLILKSPNPGRIFRFSLYLPGEDFVSIKVYNLTGRLVKTLYRGTLREELNILFDGRDERGRPLPSGVYFVKLNWRRARLGRKLILLR